MQPRGSNSGQIQRVLLAAVFIITVPIVCHLLFSHLGFNPTDDGWILAGSRRVLDGEVPHRDFISIRPAGSHIIHAALVLLGGDRTLWISRYVAWLQLACIAVAWATILDGSLRRRLSRPEWFAFALIAFCFSAHIFPIMPWHTIDGLFFASLGMMLAGKQSRIQQSVGYLLVGMAPLFRQNLAFLIPGTLIVLGAWRRKLAWVLACLPAGSYVLYLAMNGAVADAIIQLTSYGLLDVVRRGFAVYVLNAGFPVGLLLGCLVASLQSKANSAATISKGGTLRRSVQLAFIIVPIVAILSLAWGGTLFTREPSFVLFGTVAGTTLISLIRKEGNAKYVGAEALALLLAWTASLSTGYSTPALASGPLVLFLLSSAGMPFSQKEEAYLSGFRREGHGLRLSGNGLRRHMSSILLVVLLATTLVSFGAARMEYIYNEKPARYLTYDLGDVLPGGTNIRTDNYTYAVLKDFQMARQMAGDLGHMYCVLPDLSAVWIKSPQRNPLSIDWPQVTELRKAQLVSRVEAELESLRGDLVVIVQKFRADSLARGVVPLPEEHSPLVPYVLAHFTKTSETTYFELYQ